LHGELPALVQAGIILDELRASHQHETEVRYSYRNFVRQVRVLEPFVPAATEMTQMPIRHNGVYLVTGGLGGLGLIICEYLVKTFSARLVLLGRSTLQAEQREKLQRLQSYNTEVLYLQADVTSAQDVAAAVQAAKARFSRINGVIHCAGVNRDAFILKKTAAEMTQVLAPKLYGAIHLDEATRAEDLDLFVLFSSIAGVTGNIGQCDYAYGNHFLDAFAEFRSRNQHGRTLSINWPYWSEGGMSLSSDDVERMRERTGICPLPTIEGIRCWEDLIRSDLTQALPLYGNAAKIEAHFGTLQVAQQHTGRAVQSTLDLGALQEKAETYVKGLIGAEIKLAPERIDAQERFESFGIDSIVINRINTRLEKDFADLPKTLLYQYETIEALTQYLAQEQGAVLRGMFGLNAESHATQAAPTAFAVSAELAPGPHPFVPTEPIAVIGQHGVYPGAGNLRELWEKLQQGKDLVSLVPADRWDCEALYDPDPEQAAQGKIYCKWGGFLRDVDRFDAGFFNIPPAEAAIIDPQERLFLQSVWSAFEDAGYTRERLKRQHPKAKSADVGVFVGVTTSTYQFLGASSLPWSIANRVSYFFDFQGPSMPVDTACSSSLVAVDLACESLRKGECQVAVVGGVNLYLHPSKYQSFCQRRMVSADGKTHSFGAGDEGFVPAEGVGTLVLKPLTRAVADGDRILGVIRASGYQHNGRSNGYSAPNPNSQTALVSHTLAKAGISPESISYVEGHGTGTQQGDSLEILALSNAFRKATGAKQFCAVGSLKSNMGHAESAAGVAGLSKILLQFKHEQLTPTLHSEVPNPAIDFAASPFYLQHELTRWTPPSGHARRALISSFGSGGVAACVVLEEYRDSSRAVSTQSNSPCVFVLSAKNADRLREYAKEMRAFIAQEADLVLAELCYTLQTAREEMPERLAIVTADRAELLNLLSRFDEDPTAAPVYRNHASSSPLGVPSLTARSEHPEPAQAAPDLHELARRWTAGAKVEWESLLARPGRIELPTYPFAKERHWVRAAATIPEPAPRLPASQGSLHPLIMHNSSTLREVSFSSVLSDTAYYAQEHKVNGQMLFPGSGFVEIAAAAGNIVGEGRVSRIQDVVWIQPLSLQQGPRTIQISLKPTGDDAEYLITSYDDEYEKIVHAEGRLCFESGSETLAAEEQLPVASLQAACLKQWDPADYYALTERHGFLYGPAFRTLRELHVASSYALSKLAAAQPLPADFDQYLLHPCLFDGALQTVAGLAGGLEPATPYIPFSIGEVQIIRRIPPTCYVYVERADEGAPVHADVKKFNIKVANERGAVAVRIKDFCVRSFAPRGSGHKAPAELASARAVNHSR
jgi:3-oxoacyl-(acyl-carrier-protein) synthase/NADP-dependent 3-hydroxy acid dehydrogenase YdfG